MIGKKEEKSNPIYKCWWFWLIVIIVISGVYFFYGNNIKAAYLGIDVRYLENSTYCVEHSDCTATIDCEPINIYNYDNSSGVCKYIGKSGFALCYPGGCRIDRTRIGDA